MASRYLQGKFQPQFPGKYIGDVKDIVFRSSWELVAFKFCDNTKDIVKWSSETVIIPYRGVDGLMHRYFMDLAVEVMQADGTMKKFLIEIKPEAKMHPPKRGTTKRDDVFVREILEYKTNQLKWDAARAFCKKHGMEFIIWTEKDIFPNQGAYKPIAKQRKGALRPLKKKV